MEQFQFMETYHSSNGYHVQLPSNMMKKVTIKEGTCKNEEGKPACTSFYFKDKKQRKKEWSYLYNSLVESL
ncbi:hypothetical protein [Lysinibacillus endophyticus]|uniref:hypothetical protein n=1 Tax=Ureibacillus endophyticus TaxID=1978490 RepID=UPI00209FD3E7|nr:hypothetical protein [Lysinibacillus endophyticus]MCP1144748.1 hypothetical protein [Lysinibacillus endophyticus]